MRTPPPSCLHALAKPWDWGIGLAYDSVSSQTRALVALEGAEHFIPVITCEHMPWTSELLEAHRAVGAPTKSASLPTGIRNRLEEDDNVDVRLGLAGQLGVLPRPIRPAVWVMDAMGGGGGDRRDSPAILAHPPTCVAEGRGRGYIGPMQTDSVQVTISVPASLADSGAGERARVLLVLDAVRSERITWRAAASVLGLAPSAFMDLAREHGVPVVRASATDIAEDLATLAMLVSDRSPRQ